MTKGSTGGVVDGDVGESEARSRVNRESLNRGVLNVEASDRRRSSQGVSVEELGLGLSSVRALSVPPFCTLSVDQVARRTLDNNVFSGY